MRLLVMSDLHLEFGPLEVGPFQVDAVVLAGDVHVKTHGLEWIKAAFPHLPVIYVVGNHEYYRGTIPTTADKLQTGAEGSNVHVLENEVFETDGVVFLGATLWTDLNLLGDPALAAIHVGEAMSDYRLIRILPGYRRLRPHDTRLMHERSFKWLRGEVESCAGKTLVVVTHHAPSPRSLPRGWEHDVISPGYASNLEEFIRNSGVALWIHGHTHWPSDYVVGKTRILANPRGYPEEARNGFNPALVVEV